MPATGVFGSVAIALTGHDGDGTVRCATGAATSRIVCRHHEDYDYAILPSRPSADTANLRRPAILVDWRGTIPRTER